MTERAQIIAALDVAYQDIRQAQSRLRNGSLRDALAILEAAEENARAALRKATGQESNP